MTIQRGLCKKVKWCMAKRLPIVTVPNPILRQKSGEVENTPQVKKLVKRMIASLIDDKGELVGVGLSAPQVGFNWRVFVTINQAKKVKPFRVFVNPVIVEYANKLTDGVPESKFKMEGCLSIPGIYGLVRRPKWVVVRYWDWDEKGRLIEKQERFEGLVATVIQHEYDHLEGILFVDRVKEQGNKLYKVVVDEMGKEQLVEIEGDKLKV